MSEWHLVMGFMQLSRLLERTFQQSSFHYKIESAIIDLWQEAVEHYETIFSAPQKFVG